MMEISHSDSAGRAPPHGRGRWPHSGTGASKDTRGDPHLASTDPFFYVGMSGRDRGATFYRGGTPHHTVMAGVNSYSHFFFVFMKTGPKTPHGLPQRQL